MKKIESRQMSWLLAYQCKTEHTNRPNAFAFACNFMLKLHWLLDNASVTWLNTQVIVPKIRCIKYQYFHFPLEIYLRIHFCERLQIWYEIWPGKDLEFEEKWGSQMSSSDLNAFPKGLQISPEISPSLVYSLYAKNYQNRLMYVEATACHSVSLWVTQHSHHHHHQFNTHECRMNNKE